MCSHSFKLSQTTDQLFLQDAIKELNNWIGIVRSTGSCLQYPKSDHSTAHIRCYADAAFASNDDVFSKLGFIRLLCDDNGDCHILDYQSRKSQRVVTSAEAAENLRFCWSLWCRALSSNEYANQPKEENIAVYVYQFNSVIWCNYTGLEKNKQRLMIDVLATRQSYKRYDISGVGHFSWANNLADRFTILKHNKVLEEMFYERRINSCAKKWIGRGDCQSLRAKKLKESECESTSRANEVKVN